jgi:hypothetical protein
MQEFVTGVVRLPAVAGTVRVGDARISWRRRCRPSVGESARSSVWARRRYEKMGRTYARRVGVVLSLIGWGPGPPLCFVVLGFVVPFLFDPPPTSTPL